MFQKAIRPWIYIDNLTRYMALSYAQIRSRLCLNTMPLLPKYYAPTNISVYKIKKSSWHKSNNSVKIEQVYNKNTKVTIQNENDWNQRTSCEKTHPSRLVVLVDDWTAIFHPFNCGLGVTSAFTRERNEGGGDSDLEWDELHLTAPVQLFPLLCECEKCIIVS